jgi:hypothetical protein
MKKLPVLLTATALLFTGASLHANTTIFDETFDSDTTTGPSQSGAIGTYFQTINGTNVDIYGPSYGASSVIAPESGNIVDMNGSAGNATNLDVATLQSDITYGPGNYILSYDLVGNPNTSGASVTVTFGSYSQTVVLGPSDDTDGIISVAVNPTSASYITFQSNTLGYDGLYLDNIELTTNTNLTPEPSSLFLLGTGLLALAGWAGSRRRKTGISLS